MSNNNFDNNIDMLISLLVHHYGIDTAHLEVRLKADGDDLHIDEQISDVNITHAGGHIAVACKTSKNGVEPILAMSLMALASKQVCEAGDQQMEQAKDAAMDDLIDRILKDSINKTDGE